MLSGQIIFTFISKLHEELLFVSHKFKKKKNLNFEIKIHYNLVIRLTISCLNDKKKEIGFS